jgi:HK97 family phage prohead protease
MSTTSFFERRIIPAAGELRVSEENGKPKITGYSAVFNSKSEDLGYFREIIRPGCFAETIKSDDVRALFNHDPSNILGRNKAGTLKMKEDDRGLYVEIMPDPDTTWGRSVVASIKRGDIDGMSFGFRTLDDVWRTEDGKNLRELIKVQLFDVGPVTYPAYKATTADVRSGGADAEELRSYVQGKIAELNKQPDAWKRSAGERERRLKLISI